MIFLSDDNLLLHKEQINTKKLQYSILEKSIPSLDGKTVSDILGMRLSRRDKIDASVLLAEITLHGIYFSSFTDKTFERSLEVEKRYGTTASLMNSLYASAMKLSCGFVAVLAIGERLSVMASDDYVSFFKNGTPILAIDVCEHAYFRDFLFDKERYLLSALPYLDLDKIAEFYRGIENSKK